MKKITIISLLFIATASLRADNNNGYWQATEEAAERRLAPARETIALKHEEGRDILSEEKLLEGQRYLQEEYTRLRQEELLEMQEEREEKLRQEQELAQDFPPTREELEEQRIRQERMEGELAEELGERMQFVQEEGEEE